jgi:hypothetical protein
VLDTRISFAIAAPVWLTASLGLVAALRRDTFLYRDGDGAHELYRPAPLALTGALGLVVDF